VAEPGEHIVRADLEAAELTQEVGVQEGDILLVRTARCSRFPRWASTIAVF
jgi:hypothetical protein